jgi:hypothetical protein
LLIKERGRLIEDGRNAGQMNVSVSAWHILEMAHSSLERCVPTKALGI